MTYSLNDSANALRGYFIIDAYTGAVKIAKKLNYNIFTRYTMQVVATNTAPNYPSSAPATLIVNVIDVNDNAPVFDNATLPYRALVSEGASINTLVLTVRATDADAGQNGAVRYRLIGANLPFSIDMISGQIRVRSTLNFESIQSYHFAVEAYDLGTPFSQSTQESVHIDIEDVNEFAPRFIPSANYTCDVSEGALAGASCVTVLAQDDDGTGRTIIYSLADSSLFTINSATGTITYRGAGLDRETQVYLASLARLSGSSFTGLINPDCHRYRFREAAPLLPSHSRGDRARHQRQCTCLHAKHSHAGAG